MKIFVFVQCVRVVLLNCVKVKVQCMAYCKVGVCCRVYYFWLFIRCPGGREAHLQQCGRQFAQPFAELCGCQQCCFQTRRWCSRSGCSPQCRCTGVNGDGDGCVFSALSPEIHHQLIGLVDVEWEVVLLTPFSQGIHLLSVGRLIVVSDQAYHRCVVIQFDDDVGAVCGCTVVCVQGVQEWAEDAALRSTSVEDQGRWGVVAHSDFCLSGSPGSSCTEICLVPESGASQPVWQALWC